MNTEPANVVVGEPFAVRVHGSGFPLDESMADDLGARQRIKIIPADRNCINDLPPDYVEGVDCTNWFTCSPRPDRYSRTAAKWTGLTITAQKEDTRYKVCWCWGQCWNMVNWAEVPGQIDVMASGYSWSLEQPGPLTRAGVAAGLAVRVSRPSFSSTAPRDDWKLKLVKDVFDCDNLGDDAVCGGAADCGGANSGGGFELGPDEGIWTVSASADLAAGDYHVCFAEDGQTWQSIPSAGSRFLTVRSLPSDSSHPRGPFHHQSASARAGAEADVGVAGFRMWTPNQAAIAVVDRDDCYVDYNQEFPFGDVISILRPDEASSTASEYRFKGDIPATAQGKFTLCMCDADSWVESRSEARPAGWADEAEYYYYYMEDASEYYFGEIVVLADAADFRKSYGVKESQFAATNLTLSASVARHLCASKCSAGCIGADCFCDGLEDGDSAVPQYSAEALCLSPALCRSACDSEAECSGYAMHKEKNRCYLARVELDGLDASAEYDFWKAKWEVGDGDAALACHRVEDFFVHTDPSGNASDWMPGGNPTSWQAVMEVRKNVGSLFVTQKVDVGVDYIATPGEPTSLEVTGAGLDEASDRIMVIDCFGTCGVTRGTPYASIPDFNSWVAVNARIDRPSLQELPQQASIPTPGWVPFTELPGQFCNGNLVVADNSMGANHNCYKKCYAEAPCVGDNCFCDGFMSGFDTEASRALCLEQEQCAYLCAVTPGCHSVDMHSSLNRCYLNTHTCDDDVKSGQTVPDANYNLLVKPMDDNTRRLLARGRALSRSHVRQLLAAEDPGISWDQILRFKGLEFSSGGEFKLCFCDSALLMGDNAICDSPDDYKIEVGKVHATGLQCLLSNPKMTRGTCQSQEYGGLRCYDGEVPEITVPEQYLGVPNPSGHNWPATTQMLMAFCQFAPAAEAAEFKFCDQWRDTGATPAAGAGGNP